MTPGTSGVLRVDKPEGPTSHDIVARARRALRTRRVGHTGTLDPFASGLLLLCVGTATRLSESLTGLPKSYEAVARLGVRTDTDDLDGVVLEVREGVGALDVGDLDRALATLRGSLLQVPPAFSAKKVGGEAMHRKARRGEVVELPPVSVEVHALERLDWTPPFLRFRVDCSSGTYIRALARDLGEALGVGAHLSALRRTRVGDHTVEGAVSGDALDDAERVAAAWLSPREVLIHLPCLDLTPEQVLRIRMGQRITIGAGQAPEPPRATGVGNQQGRLALFMGEELVALAETEGEWILPRRVFPA
jgi:tRNA pseudouridine55 synthase